MSKTVELAKKLFSIASVTPNDNGCIELLMKELAPAGFVAEIENTPNGTTNAWITHGSGAPYFVFAGHIDVVPPGDESRWTTPPFTPSVRDGKIFARGASDMKGSVAAAAVAFAKYAKANPDHKGTIAMLITSDEEGDGYEGTMRVVDTLEKRGIRLDWCIVGEPSCAKVFGDTIKNGRRGSLNGKMTVHGKLGHVAYPHLAINPVHKAAGFLAEITSRVWDNGSEHFGPTTFQISNINAGVGAVNVVPATMTMLFNLRYSTKWSADTLIAEIEGMAEKHGLDCEFEFKRSADPFVTEPAEMCESLRNAIREATGVEAELNTSGGTSDARFISRICRETVEFGPTNGTIHSINECVGIDEIEKLEKIYGRVLADMLA